jgi:predicted TIM-barrel enzyme
MEHFDGPIRVGLKEFGTDFTREGNLLRRAAE